MKQARGERFGSAPVIRGVFYRAIDPRFREAAIAPWQDTTRSGGTPLSWKVRDRLVEAGANGLIDPSRKSPGLWHLVLFRWNDGDPGSPVVSVVDSKDLR